MTIRLSLAAAIAFSLTLPQAIPAQTQATLSDTDAIEAKIAAEGMAVGKAVATRDTGVLNRYWSPNLIVNGPTNRIISRPQIIASMNRGGLNYSSLKGHPEMFTVTNGTPILMSHEDVVMANGPTAGKHLVRRSTDIYQRAGEDWLLVARQATYIGIDGSIFSDLVTESFTPPPSTPQTDAVLMQIKANGAAVGHAIHMMDFAAIEKLWSPQLIVNGPGNNILSREQVFTAIREDKLKYTSSKVFPDTFFVVNGLAIQMDHEEIVMANGPMAGQPLKRRYTEVWQKSGDNWLMIARQATYVGIDGGAAYGHPDPKLNR